MKILLLFLILFDPQIPFAPNGVGFTAPIALVLSLGMLLKIRGGGIVDFDILRGSIPFFIGHYLVAMFSLLVILMWNGDVSYLLGVAKSVLVFVSVVLFLSYYRIVINNEFLNSLLILYSSNAAINFIVGTYPDYFSFLDLFRGKSVSDALGDNPYRNSFIAGSGYYSIGTAYGLFLLFYTYFVRHERAYLLRSCGQALVALAGFVSARISMFAIIPSVVLVVARLDWRRAFYLVLAVIAIWYLALDDQSFLAPYKSWLLGFFDLHNARSSDVLLSEMIFFPGVQVFLFGSGVVNDGSFAYTDSGFMQDILFGGVILAVLKFLFPLYFAFRMARKFPLFSAILILLFGLFQLKGAFFLSNAQGMAIFYVLFYYVHQAHYNLRAAA